MSDANLDLFYCILFSRTKEENQTFLDCDAHDFKEPYALSKEEQKALAKEIKKEPGTDIFLCNLQFEVTEELAAALKESSIKSLTLHNIAFSKGSEQKIFNALKETSSLESFEIKDVFFRNPFKAAAGFNAFLTQNKNLEEIVFNQEGLFSRLAKEGLFNTSAGELVYEGTETSAKEILSKNTNILKFTLFNNPQFAERSETFHVLTKHRMLMQSLLEKLKQAFDEGKTPDDLTVKEAANHFPSLKYLMSFQSWEEEEINAFAKKLKSFLPNEKGEEKTFPSMATNNKESKKTSVFTAKCFNLLKRKARS